MKKLLIFCVFFLMAFTDQENETIVKFNEIYYDTGLFGKASWLGVRALQNPCDNWIMQEIITEVKPDFVVESGTFHGGTTLYYAMVLEQVNPNGKVLTIDINPAVKKASQFKTFRERVEVIKGNSVSPEVIEKIRQRVNGKRVLVTLDSDHSKPHVLREMQFYGPLVSLGSYLVVQDTNGEGPYEAVQEFLKGNKDFVIDKSREKFLLTFYPSGYLKRIREEPYHGP